MTINVRCTKPYQHPLKCQVSHLDATSTLLFEQDVLWLEVTVDDSVSAKSLQALQNGVCKLPDQWQAEALELVAFDELVQVHAQQLKSHADVVAKSEVFEHVHDIHGAVTILLTQVFQDSDFLLRLPVETLLIAHHFQSQVLLQFMVIYLGHLAKATLTNYLWEKVGK